MSFLTVEAVMTYGSETWSLTMGLIRRLRVTRRAMERSMLHDQIRNEEELESNMAQRVAKLKWQWAGRITRRIDGRWSLKVLE
ncbi:jg17769 [Pararge aegeria aegeria]|uniref:Jg17769 protein n=1 Tax=Pararge aegeria aegeria TaxID=348720 RepID=A0A8S4R8B4_9NEOP|nr:jg17769 [Pararge aegeria aegeria]